MKKTILILLFSIVACSVFAQEAIDTNYRKNASRGMIYYIPMPTLRGISFSQERFVRQKLSLDATGSYVSLTGDGGWNITSVCMGTKWYIPAQRNKLRLYWINPNILWMYYYQNSQSGTSKLDNYHIGLSIGKRRYFKNEKVFWDIGVGLSYGVGVYRYYREDDETGHNNIYSFYPRFILNVGYRY
ncbi:MAG: hypothetical protein PF481_11735 [Bacteroidales bacterium]|jgi:hypothetical protein|nr:hypothetical protein [Bacteroidales bacterium]